MTQEQSYQCPKCGNIYFQMVFSVSKVSALATKTGKPALAMEQHLMCTNCKEVVNIKDILEGTIPAIEVIN